MRWACIQLPKCSYWLSLSMVTDYHLNVLINYYMSGIIVGKDIHKTYLVISLL